MKRSMIFLISLAIFVAGCGEEKNIRTLRIFHAAGMSPVIDAIRNDVLRDLKMKIDNEAYGSLVVCRQLTDLGRECDLVMLADNILVVQMLYQQASWRMDFATDEMVIAIGSRAPEPDAAEENWVAALTKKGVRIGRANEDLSPAGYRTLLTWQLQELISEDMTITDKLLENSVTVVDDVNQLTPLLKTGNIDYAFIYRSTCIAHDIRYIELPEEINLGSLDMDYSVAKVTYLKSKVGGEEEIVAKGQPIMWTLTIPDEHSDAALAREFITYLLTEHADLLKRNGFNPIKPLFYGPSEKYNDFVNISENAGELK